MHASEPSSSWYLPLAHCAHADFPMDPWNHPVGQLWHVRSSVPWVPAAHGVCAMLPAGHAKPALQLVIVAGDAQ